MRNPLAARYDEHPWDRAIFWFLFAVGLIVVVATEGTGARAYFALTAFILALSFVLLYSRRAWRTTYAGRAAMLSMIVTTMYTANATLILWWPHYDHGFPFWEQTTEFIYFAVAMAALYKLRALTRKPKVGSVNDPTTDMQSQH